MQDLASSLLIEMVAVKGLGVNSGQGRGYVNLLQAHLAKDTRAAQPMPPPRTKEQTQESFSHRDERVKKAGADTIVSF